MIPVPGEDGGEGRVLGDEIIPWLSFGPFEAPQKDIIRVLRIGIKSDKHIMYAHANLYSSAEGSIKGRQARIYAIVPEEQNPVFMGIEEGLRTGGQVGLEESFGLLYKAMVSGFEALPGKTCEGSPLHRTACRGRTPPARWSV